MRKNRADTGTITGIAEATAERVRLSGELLQALAHAIAANEKVQRKFRIAVLMRLSRIETIANLTYVAEMGGQRRNEPCFEEKLRDDAKHAEEFISQQTDHMVLPMIKYIYGETELPAPKPKARAKWSDCPSYEI